MAALMDRSTDECQHHCDISTLMLHVIDGAASHVSVLLRTMMLSVNMVEARCTVKCYMLAHCSAAQACSSKRFTLSQHSPVWSIM
jgi:hypothetical protein